MALLQQRDFELAQYAMKYMLVTYFRVLCPKGLDEDSRTGLLRMLSRLDDPQTVQPVIDSFGCRPTNDEEPEIDYLWDIVSKEYEKCRLYVDPKKRK